MISILVLFVITVLCNAAARIRDPFDTATYSKQPPQPTNPFFSFNENPTELIRGDEEDVFTALSPKKIEKLPLQKREPRVVNDQPFEGSMTEDSKFLQPGVPQKLTGLATDWSLPNNFEYFHFGENDGVVVNPAATYLDGGEFEKITMPKCHFIGCAGPFPNDGTLSTNSPPQNDKVCHRIFVPLNRCTNNKGYPMGMLCSICCECSNAFVSEMKKTYGFKIGYNA
ncbi:hypothetical protein KIN20_020360 [Parelaphostrongylus tenuis]|uniref:Uncharacterized protein n=1 Tax=Parelaphostrongylus tenuis TaxID=148309 RepID=A0AAD5QTC1_PARTN|nr:hypothetical protein KIN20_020360 [Parelaphostrongylus tenuis]